MNNTTTATNHHHHNFKNKVELKSTINGEMPENPVEEAIWRGGQEAGCGSEDVIFRQRLDGRLKWSPPWQVGVI